MTADGYSMRPYAVHVRGCRHDGRSGGRDCGYAEGCSGCGCGHPVDAERARAAILARRRRSCGICRPDRALGVAVVRLQAWREDSYGGLYADWRGACPWTSRRILAKWPGYAWPR